MVREIVWTLEAKSRYKEVIDYLLKEWGVTTALRFSKIVDRKLYLLARFPNLGTLSAKKMGEKFSSHPTQSHSVLHS
jgi:plasmid stabilization system protein ParE